MDNTNIHIFLHYPDVCLCVYTYLHAIPRNLVSSAYSICLVQEKLKGVRIHMEGVSSFKFLKFSLHLSGVFCLFICCILLKQSIAGCLGNIKAVMTTYKFRICLYFRWESEEVRNDTAIHHSAISYWRE